MPSTEEVYFTVAEVGEADVDRALAAAREAFDHGPWPGMRVSERADYLRRISQEIFRRSELLGQLWTGETGALYSMASASFASGQDEFARHAELAASFPFVERHRPRGGGDTGLLVREPVGVVGANIPWNGPSFPLAVQRTEERRVGEEGVS